MIGEINYSLTDKMKVKFITCIYSNLHGTNFGGRASRGGHYRFSLLSLLKVTDADFLCYTSEEEFDDLKKFYYDDYGISKDKLEIRCYDLKNIKYRDEIDSIKNMSSIIKSDRCHEIQFLKFFWWELEDKSYDYYYWIDSGLSHCGIIPNKYLPTNTGPLRGYFESSLFNNKFLENLISFTDNKFFIISKENVRNYFAGTVNPSRYTNYDSSLHIIGGLFGGKNELWDNILQIFSDYLYSILVEDKFLPFEENVMSLMYQNHKELFNAEYFETWWHEDSGIKGTSPTYFEENMSFYKILERLNK